MQQAQTPNAQEFLFLFILPFRFDPGTPMSTMNTKLGFVDQPVGAIVVFADGHVQTLRASVSAEQLRAMLTIDGREIIDEDP